MSNISELGNAQQRNIDPVLQITIYGIVGLLSLLCCTVTIYVIIVKRAVRSHSAVLLFDMAINDMSLVLIGVPFTIANLITADGMVTDGPLCQVNGKIFF